MNVQRLGSKRLVFFVIAFLLLVLIAVVLRLPASPFLPPPKPITRAAEITLTPTQIATPTGTNTATSAPTFSPTAPPTITPTSTDTPTVAASLTNSPSITPPTIPPTPVEVQPDLPSTGAELKTPHLWGWGAWGLYLLVAGLGILLWMTPLRDRRI